MVGVGQPLKILWSSFEKRRHKIFGRVGLCLGGWVGEKFRRNEVPEVSPSVHVPVRVIAQGHVLSECFRAQVRESMGTACSARRAPLRRAQERAERKRSIPKLMKRPFWLKEFRRLFTHALLFFAPSLIVRAEDPEIAYAIFSNSSGEAHTYTCSRILVVKPIHTLDVEF